DQGRVLVGRQGNARSILPVNQEVTPWGRQIELAGLRPQALALSPDGRVLVVSGKTSELIVLDPENAEIKQRVLLPAEKQNEPPPPTASANILSPDKEGQVSYTGLVFSPDGRWLFLSNVNGSVKVFQVAPDGTVTASHSIPLPPASAPRRKQEIPTGLAVSSDGRLLYVCGNLSNQLLEIDIQNGRVLRVFPVGVAPYDVVLVGDRAYVSNWGGRRPNPGDLVGPAGRGTEVKVDPIRHIASEGSVTVVPLGARGSAAETTAETLEILAGLHASALTVSPDRRYVVCANAAADHLSVIDTRSRTVVETIWVKPSPADLLGASPNALTFDRSGRRLYVANGTQNAVAVVRFSPARKRSRLMGLIPSGWYPGALLFDGRRNQLVVANIKGLPIQPKRNKELQAEGYNSHHYHGSVSLMPLPKDQELASLTAQVEFNYRRERIAHAMQPPRPNQAPRPVPERIGEPSTIRNVVYVIKENRTYDQVLGDVPEGNGDARLCIFGEDITPNQHKMIREFVLLDNTYCAGILSADGHQWSTTAFGTDYLEKSFAGWPRSYPDGMGEDENDALAYAPSGFIWDNAVKHGLSIWNFGEFAMPMCRWADASRKGEPAWKDYWQEFLQGRGEVVIASQPSVESIRPYTPTNYVGWIMAVPDVWRARYITNQLAAWEQDGNMPRLVLICLPSDHTSGTSRGSPTPAACVADNDLAFGQIVQAFSHSRFWSNLVIFGIEDDPQNGWDHVSGYRTTAYVASPWAKRKTVVSTQFSTISILRTIEQILGMPPMNQFDASADPMFECFTETPDYTPFMAVANRVPLDQMNPDPQALRDPVLRKDAQMSSRINFRQVDRAPEDLLNRILWRAMRGSRDPYPEWAVSLIEDEDED
ncbi:MAG TPA: alkaline phosphatase family protein, partial [Candidatus Paceibacterota bacterium]|nr:alkaline phosphatase family protein [Candidatus Paceibacterota bacterium]